MTTLRRLGRLWFTFDFPVDRRTYLSHGAALMAFKYAVDAAVIGLTGKVFWTPLDYFSPLLVHRGELCRCRDDVRLADAAAWRASGPGGRAGDRPAAEERDAGDRGGRGDRCGDGGAERFRAQTQPRSSADGGVDLSVAFLTVALAGGALLLYGIEGLACIAMAAPLALLLAFLGASVGRTLAVRLPMGSPGLTALALLPLLALVESASVSTDLREVVTAVEIDAPPERVWREVVAFSELPEPTALIFRLGIAYPVRARIEGAGVGAVRRCEFSTGAFVEPITVWDEPNRLGFDVTAQPAPLEEWSPYKNLHPPHLDNYFRSKRGEFRLIALPGDRTRLEGSTWYELELFPQVYWRLLADVFVHRLHARVLRHVKAQSEGLI